MRDLWADTELFSVAHPIRPVSGRIDGGVILRREASLAGVVYL